MKLFNFERPTIVRVDIHQKGECKTFSVDENDSTRVANELKKILSKKVSVTINPTESPQKTKVQCYEHTGKEKGKYKTFTIYGLTVSEAYEIVMNNLEK